MQLRSDYGFTWGYTGRSLPYVEVDAGWVPLVELLCEDIGKVLDEHGVERSCFAVHCVKEKFGSLRFYFGMLEDKEGLWDKIDDLVVKAEKYSTKTCEICGSFGKLSASDNYWYKTVCDRSDCNMDGKYIPLEDDE